MDDIMIFDCAAHNVDAVLGSEVAWYESFQGIPFPQPHFMLVFVGDTEEEEHMAATKAAAAVSRDGQGGPGSFCESYCWTQHTQTS